MGKKSKLKILCSIFFPILILLVSLTIVNTVAKYIVSSSNNDSAEVAEFNIEIIAPQELATVSEENPLEYLFKKKEQTLSFDFKIINNEEVSVICVPYFDSDVQFDVIVDETICDDFIVEIGETVDFTIVVLPDGLELEALATSLVIEVEQL